VINLSMSLEEFSLSSTVDRYDDRCIVADGILIEVASVETVQSTGRPWATGL
jgi:hypothetical protein